jgi:Rrf2 family protein
MRLTRASVYALHAVAYMASQEEDGPIPSGVIADERDISERFLLKVLKPLVTARILTSAKGPHGGYRLAKPANQITLLEVMEAVDEPILTHAPIDRGDPNHPLNQRLEQVCNQSAEQLRRQLGRIKIADVIGKD